MSSPHVWLVEELVDGAFTPKGQVYETREAAASRLIHHWSPLAPVRVARYVRAGYKPAAALGKLGGKAKSPAKSAAARANGRKGGRPRK